MRPLLWHFATAAAAATVWLRGADTHAAAHGARRRCWTAVAFQRPPPRPPRSGGRVSVGPLRYAGSDGGAGGDHGHGALLPWSPPSSPPEERGDDVVDACAADTRERRRRRRQSLEAFNRAARAATTPPGGAGDAATSGGGRAWWGDGPPAEADPAPPAPPPSPSGDAGLLPFPLHDPSQVQAAACSCPALLLPSGPGTGKSHVLALRIAHLLRGHVARRRAGAGAGAGAASTDGDAAACAPDELVVLSFTNRDAARLKRRALDGLFPASEEAGLRNETSRRLWAGTMHAFALAILREHGAPPGSSVPRLRVLPARETEGRAAAVLRARLADPGPEGAALRERHRRALGDVRLNHFALRRHVVRCLDLWREAGVPLHRAGGEAKVRKACVQLARRVGVPESAARLALGLYPEYQVSRGARVSCTSLLLAL